MVATWGIPRSFEGKTYQATKAVPAWLCGCSREANGFRPHFELLEMIGAVEFEAGNEVFRYCVLILKPEKSQDWNLSTLKIKSGTHLNVLNGSEVAGHRGYFLTGPGVLLNQALINYGPSPKTTLTDLAATQLAKRPGLAFLSQRGYTPLPGTQKRNWEDDPWKFHDDLRVEAAAILHEEGRGYQGCWTSFEEFVCDIALNIH